jgi:hypothetical protein
MTRQICEYIKCTSIRATPEEAELIAVKEYPDILTRAAQWIIPGLRKHTEVVKIEPFYCRYYYGIALISVHLGKQQRSIKMAAVMPSAINMVKTMVGTPQFMDISVPKNQIVKDVYTIEEAREKLTDYMRRRGYKKLRSFPRVDIESLSTVYKPFYHCVCKCEGKIFSRVVDAEIGQRDYLLDIQYKKFRF